MSPSPGAKRKWLLTFVSGVSIGYIVTHVIANFHMSDNEGSKRSAIFSHHFIPDQPHSHGEMDQFVGPDQEQNWQDFDVHAHEEDDSIANNLTSKVKILCWIMTSPSNLQSKARHIKATWGKRCNKLLFMSSKWDHSFPAIGLDVNEGRDNLWDKTKEAFKFIYKHHLQDADWFFKADDDTYCVLENMRLMLSDHNPKNPIYFGRRFRPYVRQGYMSGGAGYVLSKESLQRFVEQALPDTSNCRADPGGAEDLEMGMCLQAVGVRPGDSRDTFGKETFHPFIPEHHLIWGMVPRDNWYWEYNYYPAREGPDCCSDFAISFHYVPPNMMYVFEYFVYHLKPYGITSKLLVPLDINLAKTSKDPVGQLLNAQTKDKNVASVTDLGKSSQVKSVEGVLPHSESPEGVVPQVKSVKRVVSQVKPVEGAVSQVKSGDSKTAHIVYHKKTMNAAGENVVAQQVAV